MKHFLNKTYRYPQMHFLWLTHDNICAKFTDFEKVSNTIIVPIKYATSKALSKFQYFNHHLHHQIET